MLRLTVSLYSLIAIISLLITSRHVFAQEFCTFSMDCNCEQNVDYSYTVICVYFEIFPTFSPFNGTVKSVEVTGPFTSIPSKAFYNLTNFPSPTVTFLRQGHTLLDPLTVDDDAFVLANSQVSYASITFENYKNFSIPTKALSKISVDSLKFLKGQYDTIPADAFNGAQCGNINFLLCTVSSVDAQAFRGLTIPPDLTNEVTVDFEINNLIEISKAFGSIPGLAYLYLGSNQIQQIDANAFCSVENCSTLRTVVLQSNLIANISDKAFDSVTGVTRLVLSGNRLTSLPKLPLANLFEIALDNNQLSVIPMAALTAASGSLYNLNLASNQIAELGVNTFAGFTQLQTVTLDFNPITVVAPGAYNGLPWYELALSNLTELSTLDVLVVYGMPNVQSLTVSQCPALVNVTMASPKKVPSSLRTIKLRNTGVRTLDPQFADWLKSSTENTLDISFNSDIFCNTSDIEWMAAPAICHPVQIQMQNTFCGDTKLPLFAVLDVEFPPFCN